jgi:hypothetical protein
VGSRVRSSRLVDTGAAGRSSDIGLRIDARRLLKHGERRHPPLLPTSSCTHGVRRYPTYTASCAHPVDSRRADGGCGRAHAQTQSHVEAWTRWCLWQQVPHVPGSAGACWLTPCRLSGRRGEQRASSVGQGLDQEGGCGRAGRRTAAIQSCTSTDRRTDDSFARQRSRWRTGWAGSITASRF